MYLAFFKTILAALFRTFGLPLRFLPSKPPSPHDHFTTQHSDFSSFLAVTTTNKPENRNIHAYAVTYLNVFALRRFIFRDFTKNKEGVRAIRAIKYGKYTRARAPLARKYTNRIFPTKDGTTSMRIVN